MEAKKQKPILINGILKLGIYFILAIILAWPVFLGAQESVTLNEPSPDCLGSEAFVSLNWTSTISGTPVYFVLRKIQGEPESSYIELASTTNTFYTDDVIESDKDYNYKIRAERGTDIFFSNEVLSLAPYCPPVLSPPITSCQLDGPHINLSWSSVSGSLSTYEVFRDGIKINPTLNTIFDDGPNIEGTKTYNYFIRAIWQDGIVKDSDSASTTALACPPTLITYIDCLTTAPGGPKVNLSWNSLLGVQNYQVYRKAQSEAGFSLLKTLTTTSFVDNLVETLPTYWQGGPISYYVKAIWETAEKNSDTQQRTIPRCSPYLTVESNCDEFSFRLSWTATLDATHYNIYRDGQFVHQNIGITSTSYTDGLNLDICPGQICTFTYHVEAIVTGFPNVPSNSVTKDIDCATIVSPSPAPVLDTPNAYCVDSDSRISLSWTPSENVTYYTIYRNGVDIVNLLETSYVDTGVESGYEYTYYVVAYGKGGTSTTSENAQTITAVDCTPPSAPVLTLSSDCTNGQPYVDLSWSSTTNTFSYEIHRGASATDLVLLRTFEKDSPEFSSRTWQDTDVSPSTTYYYKVVAKGPEGVTPSSSDIKSITTSSCLPTTPNLYSLSRGCEGGNPVITLYWSTDGANTTRYEIFRKDYSQATPIKIIYDISVKSWKDTSVSPETTYEYKVEAVGYLDTQRSTQGYKPVTAYNCEPPGPLTLSDPTVYCQGAYPWADLSWTESSNSTSYDLYRNLLNPDDTIAETTEIPNVTSPFTDKGFGNALSFDGSDDYVNIPNSASLNPNIITMEAWIYPTAFNYYGNIITKRYPAQYILRLYGYTGRVQGYIYSDGWRACTTPSSIAVTLNRWNHVVHTYDGTTGRVYVNGVEGCTYTYTGNINSGDSTLRIGSYYTGATASERFKGFIDEVRIYGRALSPAEVPEHYQGIYSNEIGLVGWWPFYEGTGQVVYDGSTEGNNGTLGPSTAVENSDPTWIQGGPLSENRYSWQVKAIGPGGSTLSNTTAPTLMPICTPTKPGLVLTTYCEAGNSVVNLSWSYSINTVSYEIYREGATNPIKTITSSDPEFSTRTWTDNNQGLGLTPETTYTYWVVVIGPTGLTTESDHLGVITVNCLVPTQPQNATTTFECNGSYPQVKLTWEDSSSTDYYYIYRNDGPTFGPITDTDSPTYTYYDTTAEVNTFYSYTVKAFGSGGESLFSNPAELTTGYCPPSTPSIVLLTTNCQNLFPINDIAWSDTTPFNTSEYKIYRNTTGASPLDTDLIITITSVMPEFSSRIWQDNSGLSPSITYYYWIKAVGPIGESSFSASKSIETYSCGLVPGTPTLSLGSVSCVESYPQAILSWGGVSNAYSYNLYRTNPDNSTSTYSTRLSPLTDRGSFALNFDGVNDYAIFDSPDSLNDLESITLETWFYQTAYIGWLDTWILDKDYTGYRFGTRGDNFRAMFRSPTQGWQTISWGKPELNTWYHFVAQYDAMAKKLRLFVNGELKKEITSGERLNFDYSSVPLRIAVHSTGAKYWPGIIDEVRIYNRVLSSSEINEHSQGIYKNETELKGAWHFDEGEGQTAFDSSGYGNNGITGGPIWVTGKINNALQFDGSNDYVDCGDPASLQLTDDMSVEFWAKPLNIASGRQNIVCKAYGGEFCLTMETSGSLNYYHGSCGGMCWPYMGFGTGNMFSNDTWVHVVLTRDMSTRTMSSYKNGSFVRSTTWTSDKDPSVSTYSLKVGAGYVNKFNGLIDEVRLYNRVLSSTEITEHYNGIFTDETGSVGLWHFDEREGETAFDDSGQGNNGTLIRGQTEWIAPFGAPTYVGALEREKLYKYYVKAFGLDTESSTSNEVSITTPSCLPAKPNLVVTPQCDGASPQLSLSWDLDPYDLTEYWSVYKRREGEAIFTHLINVSAPAISYIDDNVEGGIRYDYYLEAVGEGASVFSDVVSETAPFCYNPPYGDTPFPISATSTCFGYAPRNRIEWEIDPTGNTISYNILRKNTTLGETEFSQIDSGLTADTTQYIDINVEEANSYIYEVEAVGSGEGNTLMSQPSQEVTAYECSRIPPFPPALSLNFVYAVDHRFAVSIGWTDAGNEEEYKIFRRLAGESTFALENQSFWQKLLSYFFGKNSLAAYEYPLATTTADILNYVDETVAEDTAYEYQIIASNKNGETFSNIISATVPIARPGNFTLSCLRIAGPAIHLTWADASTTIAGGPVTFNLYRDDSEVFGSPTNICTVICTQIPCDQPLECDDNNPSWLEPYYKAVASNNGGSTEADEPCYVGFPPPIWKEIPPW